jgi:hypothetical protein
LPLGKFSRVSSSVTKAEPVSSTKGSSGEAVKQHPVFVRRHSLQ